MPDDHISNSIPESPSDGEFGQEYSLVNALHKLVHDYPLGVGLFKEFIQNADDAEASVVRFILDKNDYSDLRFHSPKLKVLAEPSLLIWNDAPFKPQDVENIQNLGDSHKVRKPANTGKFGLGFNTCYNITDFPVLLTGESIYLFDPHKSAYDYQNGSRPGYRWQITPQRWSDSPGLLKPFEQLGLSPAGPRFVGAAFRLPLRTHGGGKIKLDRVSPEKIEELLQEFIRFAPSILLFLKNLVRIEFQVVGPGYQGSDAVLTISTKNEAEVQQGRSFINQLIKSDLPATLQHLRSQDQSALQACYQHVISVARPNQAEQSYRWLVSTGLFRGTNDVLLKTAEELWDRKEKVLPWAGVAGLMPSADGTQLGIGIPGEVFCFLPLPNVRGNCRLPVHLNGYFDVDTSRSGLTHETSAKESIERLRGRWNKELLMEAVAPAYASLLLEILNLRPNIEPESFYRLWLNPSQDFPPPLDSLCSALYARLSNLRLLKSAAASWEEPGNLRLTDATLRPPLVAERWAKIANPEVPERILAGFTAAGVPIRILQPAELREFLRQDTDVDCKPDKSSRKALQTREWLVQLALFAFKDAEAPEFSGLPLLLLADGTLHTFGFLQSDSYLAGESEREIFSKNLEWFVDAEYVVSTDLTESSHSGLARMSPEQVLKCLSGMFEKDPSNGYAIWNPDGAESPNEIWLCKVYDYFLAQPPDWKPDLNLLQQPCLVPDQNRRLWPCGQNSTPLYVPSEVSVQLRRALKALDVQLVSGGIELLVKVEAFAKRFGRIWPVSPRDLADILSVSRTGWESRLSHYDAEIFDPILHFFSSDEALKSYKLTSDNRLDAIARLPIFPCQNADLIAINDHQCFIASEVYTPNIPLPIKLIRPGIWRGLLDALNVKPLGLKAIIEEVLLPNYVNLSESNQLLALAWIRDQLEPALTEAGPDSPKLLGSLESAKLILGSDGSPYSCNQLYDPKVKIIREVLGNHAVTPNMELYGREWDRWQLFFKRFGMNQTPQPQGLAKYISSLIAVNPLDEGTEAKLTHLLHHIVEHWKDLKAGQFTRVDGTKTSFVDFLRTNSWCPPLRGEKNLRHLLVPLEPPLRLFRLAELSPPILGHLVASVRYLMPIEQRDTIPNAIRDLAPESVVPPLSTVSSHFSTLLAKFNGTGTIPDKKAIRTPLQRIYTYFGRIHRRNQPALPTLDDEDSNLGSAPDIDEEEFETVRQQFAGLRCIYIDSANCFALPKDAFREDVSYATIWWHQSNFGQPEIEAGLSFLGRQEKPEFSDFCRLTCEIHASSEGEPLLEEKTEQLLRVLFRLIDVPPVHDPLPEIYLLDRGNCTVKSSDVFVHDAAWLDDKLKDCPVRLHHPQLPIGIILRLKLRRLSEHIRTEPEGEWPPSLNAGFVDRCVTLSGLLKSPEFKNGLRRILLRKGSPDHSIDLDWLNQIVIKTYQSLNCSHHIDDEGNDYEIARGPELFFHEFELGPHVLSFSEAASEVLYEQMASAIQRVVGPENLADLSPLAKILQYSPDRIESILDKLRISRLNISDTPEEEQNSSEGKSTFFDSEGGNPPDGSPEIENDHQTDPLGDDLETSFPDGETKPKDSANGDDRTPDQEHGPGTGRKSGIYPRGHSSTRGWGGRSKGSQKQSFPSTSDSQPKGRLASYPAPQSQKTQHERKNDQSDDELPINHEIGRWAVHWVLQYERLQGRTPTSMAHNNPGYDVESRAPMQQMRYIEVKGIRTQWDLDGVPVSPTQIDFARKNSGQFWLYVVEFALEPERVKIHCIHNPVEKITQYRFDSGWNSETTNEKPFAALKPTLGNRAQWRHEGELRRGTIVLEGKMLQVRLDNGHQTGVAFKPIEVEILPP